MSVRWLFAGDPRAWRVAAAVGVPLSIVVAIWCLVPRTYLTGSNSVETLTYVVQTPAGHQVCVFGLDLPAGTARLGLALISRTQRRPALQMNLRLPGRTVISRLPARLVDPSRISRAVFSVPAVSAHGSGPGAQLCLRAGDLVNWGGAPVVQDGFPAPPTLDGKSIGPARITVIYLPRAGSTRSYVSELTDILHRASLFRPGLVGPWLYWLILFGLLPLLALAAVRVIAQALAGEARRFGPWIFGICALNAVCWALIIPVFHAPDEVDHFAYVASLATHGKAPENAGAPRWSSAEGRAIAATHFLTDHQVGDTKAPWTEHDVRLYDESVRRARVSDGDGGGIETASTHGPIYYLALVPGFLLAGAGHVFSQLTLARISSALIGAIAALCAYLMGLELAPRRRWLAVIAGLLVAYEPMFGMITGSVNNDSGVDAGAAVAELLLLRTAVRGFTLRRALATGLVLGLLPLVKATAFSLWVVAGVAVLVELGRRLIRPGSTDRLRAAAPVAAWGAAWAVAYEALTRFSNHLRGGGGGAAGAAGAAASGNAGLHDPRGLLSYLWQSLLPRLPGSVSHFQNAGYPFRVIFVERGFAAFGFYTVYFPGWVYTVIEALLYSAPVLGAVSLARERVFVRSHLWPLALLTLFPMAVIAGFESAFYTNGARDGYIAEFGRYAFPAIGPLAIIAVGSLHAFGRRLLPWLAVALAVTMIVFCYASQLLTLASFFA